MVAANGLRGMARGASILDQQLIRELFLRRGCGIFWRGRACYRSCGHCALGIQQVLVVGAESKFDESAGVWNDFALPSIIGLKFFHRPLAGLIPGSGGFALHVAVT